MSSSNHTLLFLIVTTDMLVLSLMYNCCTAAHSLYMLKEEDRKHCVRGGCITMMREKLYNLEISVQMSEKQLR